MTSADVDFDVVVVGAGPAGSVTARQVAAAGHSVVLVERGAAPGEKNLSGGVLYGTVLGQLFPDYLTEAPVERRVARNVITFLNGDSRVSIDYDDERLVEPTNAVTVLRARFDPWLAERAEDAGAMVMSGVRVDGVLTEKTGSGTRVVGVRAGNDELRAHVVVAADGVNSFLAREAGLRPPPHMRELALGVKAVLALPRDVIDARFGVTGDRGAAHAIVGDCTRGVGGGGFVYTNRESVSVGVVLRLDDLRSRGLDSAEVFEHFLVHPAMADLLRDGEVVEYGSHLVAEGGLAAMGPLCTDGMVVVGDAAGLTINSGLTVRGMDLAIGSGIAAAEAIDEALAAQDVRARSLARYRRALFAGFVGQDMTTYAKAPAFLERPRMYGKYGELLADVLHGAFDLDTTPRRHLTTVARQAFAASGLRWRDVARDALAGARAL